MPAGKSDDRCTMGQLVYVIGASGAGKDTLIQYARTALNGSGSILFAHRYITRPPVEGKENHQYLSEQEFRQRRDAGLFAFSWDSHGSYYGIGIEIEAWLEAQFTVVINGSRLYLDTARQRYPHMTVVHISASEETIQDRLNRRGRENADQIKSRMTRSREMAIDFSGLIVIQNDSSVEEAGNALLAVLTGGTGNGSDRSRPPQI
jgi:ribose 1,5-bisphosphokinase